MARFNAVGYCDHSVHKPAVSFTALRLVRHEKLNNTNYLFCDLNTGLSCFFLSVSDKYFEIPCAPVFACFSSQHTQRCVQCHIILFHIYRAFHLKRTYNYRSFVRCADINITRQVFWMTFFYDIALCSLVEYSHSPP